MDRLENRTTYSPSRVIVVGGGWAGLSCAYALTRWGYPVTVLEASPQWGGRARTVHWSGMGTSIDNGQHILSGAYSGFLNLMQELGLDEKTLFERHPFSLSLETEQKRYHLQIKSWLPAPWHLTYGLLTAKGWSLREKWQIFKAMRYIRYIPAQTHQMQSVRHFLEQREQSTHVIDTFWAPLLLAALSTPLESASAYYAIQVLQAVFGGAKSHSDLLLPLQPLNALLPEPLVEFLETQGQSLSRHQRVQELLFDETRETCLGVKTQDSIYQGKVVLAIPHRAQRFIPPDCLFEKPKTTEYQPIITLYFAFEFPPRLNAALVAILKQDHYWIFQKQVNIDRSILAIVLTGKGAHTLENKEVLMDRIQEQLQADYPEMGQCLNRKCIQEKFAAFSCGPEHIQQQGQYPFQTKIKNLWICGDETHPNYPATLEGAIQSGLNCALEIREN